MSDMEQQYALMTQSQSIYSQQQAIDSYNSQQAMFTFTQG
jgi:hypothetical protein